MRLRPAGRDCYSCSAMGERLSSTPRHAPGRATAVATFYGGLTIIGFFWHAVAQDTNDIWRVDPDQTLLLVAATPLIGVAFGLLTVQVFRVLQSRMIWLGDLHREFRSIFGAPGRGELLLLAAASAVGEEVFFRGAMLDAWGLWISSVVFALLHIPPKRALWPWTFSSLVLGLALGGLTILTGNLGAAVAAHFVINWQNLEYITRNRPPVAFKGPVRPAP
jgi:membrane protease YdiL (CAAX protease family)